MSRDEELVEELEEKTSSLQTRLYRAQTEREQLRAQVATLRDQLSASDAACAALRYLLKRCVIHVDSDRIALLEWDNVGAAEAARVLLADIDVALKEQP